MNKTELVEERIKFLLDFKRKLMDYYTIKNSYNTLRHGCQDPFNYGRSVQISQEIDFLKSLVDQEASK